MKRKLLLLALGLIFSLNLKAQNDLKFGINAGLNYPDIRGNELAKYNNFKVGYLVGISFDYYLNEDLSIKSNLNYERKIKKIELTHYDRDAEKTGSTNYREYYDYINFPILVKYEFWNSNFFVNGGPFFNYLLSNKIKPTFPIEDTNATELRKIDLGFSFGVGTNISLSANHKLTIELRDDFGMIDTGGVPKQVEGTVKTNVIKLMVGWNMGI